MADKQIVFNEAEIMLTQSGFTIVQQDRNRPWGGFFVIDENQAVQFANRYFPVKILIN